MLDGHGGGEHHGGGHHGGSSSAHSHAMGHHGSHGGHHGSHGGHHGSHGSGPSHATQSAFGHGMDLGGLAASLGSGEHGQHNSHIGHGVGHVHGPATGHSVAWAFGHAGMALAYMGALDPATASKSQARDGFEVRLPGIIYGENSVQLLVWPHGKCDTRGLFRAVAARFGLRSLSRLPGCSLVASSKTHNELLDTKLFDGPGKFTKPSTWFKGADGITETWTEYYQLPFSQGFWRSADVDLGPPMPSHIIATGYTWYVEQIGDFETRVALTATNPMTCKGGRWVPDDVKCARQFAAATRVAEAMREELVQIKPKKRATLLRQMVSNLHRSTLVAEDKHGESCGLSTRHHNGPGPGPLPQSLRNGSADMIRWDLQGQ